MSELRIVKTTIVLFLAFLGAFSTIPIHTFAEDSGVSSKQQMIEVINDTEIYNSSEVVVGMLTKGTTIQIIGLDEQRVYFDWEGELSNISKDSTKLLDLSEPSIEPEEAENKEVILESEKEVEDAEPTIVQEVTIKESNTVQIKSIREFTSSDKYFQVVEDSVSVYVNNNGKLDHVGYLMKGEVYYRNADYGDWHQIKFGNSIGYVWKAATVPSTNKNSSNLVSSSPISTFTPTENVTVYDNSSGSLVPFLTISKGVKYPYLNDWGDWYRVEVSGRIGFVYKTYTTKEFLKSDKYYEAVESNIPIYDNSDGTLKTVGYLKKGEVFSRISDYGDWHQVRFGNGLGYVWKLATRPTTQNKMSSEITTSTGSQIQFISNEDLTVYDNSSGNLVPFATLYKNSKIQAISEMGDWYVINVSGRKGYVYKPATTRIFGPDDQFFSVNEEDLTIYDNSTGSLVPVGTLSKGQTFSRVSDYGDWHKIQFGDKYGFVWKGATKVADNRSLGKFATTENKNITFKATTGLTVYDNSSGALVPMGTIKEGQIYQAKSINGDWLQVQLSGRSGYVYKGGVEIISGTLFGKVIVLDAGHGGHDPGAIGKTSQEKALNIQTVLEVSKVLEEEGATVILTRNSDYFLSLQERVDISANYKPHAFISVHYNSSTSSSSRGVETYYFSNDKDLQLAKDLHEGIVSKVELRDRGARYENFFVIRENKYPAVLLELGFISNQDEENIIKTNSYHKKVASGVLHGLNKYFNRSR